MTTLRIHNPNSLPTLPYTQLQDFQGDFKHPIEPEALRRLKESLIKHGVFVPKFVWFDNGAAYILDGHQTTLALTSLADDGWTIPDIPYVEVHAETRSDAAEKLLQLNSRYAAINPESEWITMFDFDVSAMLNSVSLPEFDLRFPPDPDDPKSPEQLDTIPPEPATPITQPGDLWQLGQHRLFCGDSTKADDVARLMQGEQAAMCFTSPPYAEQRKQQYGGVPETEYVAWWDAIQQHIRTHLDSTGSVFVNIKAPSKNCQRSLYVYKLVIAMVERWQWRFIDEFCWLRIGIPGDPKKMRKFRNRWESIFHFVQDTGTFAFYPDAVTHDTDDAILDTNYRSGAAGRQGKGKTGMLGERLTGQGEAYPGNVLALYQNAEALGHPAAFPVPLPSFFIEAFTQEGNHVIDPFGGSGTTLIACEQLGRHARLMELLPAYCDIILRRYQQTFEKDDVFLLDGDLRVPYADVEQARQ